MNIISAIFIFSLTFLLRNGLMAQNLPIELSPSLTFASMAGGGGFGFGLQGSMGRHSMTSHYVTTFGNSAGLAFGYRFNFFPHWYRLRPFLDGTVARVHDYEIFVIGNQVYGAIQYGAQVSLGTDIRLKNRLILSTWAGIGISDIYGLDPAKSRAQFKVAPFGLGIRYAIWSKNVGTIGGDSHGSKPEFLSFMVAGRLVPFSHPYYGSSPNKSIVGTLELGPLKYLHPVLHVQVGFVDQVADTNSTELVFQGLGLGARIYSVEKGSVFVYHELSYFRARRIKYDYSDTRLVFATGLGIKVSKQISIAFATGVGINKLGSFPDFSGGVYWTLRKRK